MPELKDKFNIFNKIPLRVAGIALLFFMAVMLLLYNSLNSSQSVAATAARLSFEGQYRIGDGPWQEIVEGQHIPATKGDVTLRGNFHLFSPDGEYIGIYDGQIPVAFYTKHISLVFRQGDSRSYTIDHENPLFGASACGVDWTAHSFSGGEETIEILVHNPHRFGNGTAIDELLANVAIWGNIEFERNVLESGKSQRNTGMFLVIVALLILGTALFSVLLHIKNNRIIWRMGMAILFAGIYLTYSAPGVSFWSESIANSTAMLGLSMMFYMLFISGCISYFLQSTKKVCVITNIAMGIVNGMCFLLPIVTKIHFYDTLPFWACAQTVSSFILLGGIIIEYLTEKPKNHWIYAIMVLMLIAFEADALATAMSHWSGALISKYVFWVLVITALFVVLRIIPSNINAAAHAKELELQRSILEAEKNAMEAELKDSRISIMLSQIQPHFIYNTLGTIERMCLKDPEKAFELVRNFSLYLRGNFSELDSVTPIRFSEELKHVEHYVNIEKVRFPDMNIEYDVQTTDFVLPALSVQPLVENAIKHGLMRLESGGRVLIRSYETEQYFCVEVKDDGVGFDTELPIDGKKHVGLRNIRGRLNAMVNGELTIESSVGAGTKAVITIPKEVST